ncbi:hypothetical protein ACFL1E_05980 [Candidatus Omnitrophota bacterium]
MEKKIGKNQFIVQSIVAILIIILGVVQLINSKLFFGTAWIVVGITWLIILFKYKEK